MDVTQYGVPSCMFKSAAQESRIFQVVESDCTVTLKTKMQEVEVLSNDGCCWSREVE